MKLVYKLLLCFLFSTGNSSVVFSQPTITSFSPASGTEGETINSGSTFATLKAAFNNKILPAKQSISNTNTSNLVLKLLIKIIQLKIT